MPVTNRETDRIEQRRYGYATAPREYEYESRAGGTAGTATAGRREPPEVRRTARALTGGSTIEGIAGAIAALLAVIGLVGAAPAAMAAIAAVVLGVGLVAEGGAIAARYSRLIEEIGGGRTTSADVTGGMSAQLIGGAAGVVLGVLALFGLNPIILLACAAIVFGATLVIGAGVTADLNDLTMRLSEEGDRMREATRGAVSGAAGMQVLVGLAVIVMGIIALTDVEPGVLILSSMLVIGGMMLLTGSAITSRMVTLFRR